MVKIRQQFIGVGLSLVVESVKVTWRRATVGAVIRRNHKGAVRIDVEDEVRELLWVSNTDLEGADPVYWAVAVSCDVIILVVCLRSPSQRQPHSCLYAHSEKEQ
jgi:hypothetical protein